MKGRNDHREWMPDGRPVATAVAIALTIFLAIGLAAPPLAHSADVDDLIKEGISLRRRGDDVRALRRFQEAFEIDKSPRVIVQIGLAEQALGRWPLAHEHLTQALQAKKDPWIAKNRDTIVEALNMVSEHLGKIEILGGSPRAEIRIDGVLRGTLPLTAPLTLSTGTVTVDLSAPGFVPQQRTTVVRARQTTRESFDALAPVPVRDQESSPPAVATGPSRKKKVAAPAEVPERPADDIPSESDPRPDAPTTESPATGVSRDAPSAGPSSVRSGLKWVAWGLGGAGVGLGLFGLVRHNDAADSFDSNCVVDGDTVRPLPGSTATPDACRGFRTSTDSNFRLEVIGFVSAAVFVGAGLALWLTEPKADDPTAVAWACLPGVPADGGLSLGCNVRF